MTNHWVDFKNADLVWVMGGNPAEAHPAASNWVIEAKKQRKAKLIVVVTRASINRTAAVADVYAPIRPGSNIAFFGGVINYLLSNDKIHHEYVKHYTNAAFLIDPGFGFEDGLFSGYDETKRSYGSKDTWKYQMGPTGSPRSTKPCRTRNCVFQLMKKHYSRYTPEMVNKVCGTPKDAFLKICELVATTAAPNKTMAYHLYALGLTEHSNGSQNIRCAAMIQLLLGNMGMAGGGINALRGHSNVQGITDMCLYAQVLPGYLGAPTDGDKDFETYVAKRTPKALRPNQMNFPQNFPKWYASLAKAWYGNAATKENGFAYDYFPKLGGASDALSIFNDMFMGKVNGFFCQGFNPLASLPNKKKVGDALAKLKYMIVIDPLATDTSEFWKPHGEFNEVDPSKIQTEVFRLPATFFAETSGTLTNPVASCSGAGRRPPMHRAIRRTTPKSSPRYSSFRAMYAKEGGAFPDAIRDLTWAYNQPFQPVARGSAEGNQRQGAGRRARSEGPDQGAREAGDQLPSFAMLRDDGSTSCGNWIYCGTWSQAGNNTARRDNSDPSGLGQTLNWGYAWPVNRRIIYNRASADLQGKPWDASRTVLKWTGSKWAATTSRTCARMPSRKKASCPSS